jgi:hypothetical protein
MKRAPSWSNPADLFAWLHELRETARDLGEAALDLTRPEHERALGTALAKETLTASRAMLYEMLDLGMASLTKGTGEHGAPN